MEIYLPERSNELPSKTADPKCALLMMTDGLEETETVGILCKLRQTGLCVKSVGLTSSLVAGVHGILLKPDLTLADFGSNALDIRAVKMVILTERNQGMARLETEPRLHHLLLHTLLHGGYVAVDREGQRIMKAIDVSVDQLKTCRENRQILVHDWQQSVDAYTSELIRCFEALPQTRSNHKSVRKLST
jgi:hypothetical protein